MHNIKSLHSVARNRGVESRHVIPTAFKPGAFIPGFRSQDFRPHRPALTPRSETTRSQSRQMPVASESRRRKFAEFVLTIPRGAWDRVVR